jgi:hypothetical protein
MEVAVRIRICGVDTRLELYDIEEECVLLLDGTSWFGFLLDEMLNCTAASLLTGEPMTKRRPSCFGPFTRRMPAANSGLSSPQSAAS